MKVSTLLPVRNGASTLRAALTSLANQTHPAHEIIVVDDGSTDGTAEILERAKGLKVLTTPGIGLVGALTLAADHAQGELLARMDADDLSHPCRIERQVAWLQRHPEVGVVSCLVKSFGDDGPITGGWRRYEAWVNGLRRSDALHLNRFVESPLPHPSVMMRRDDFDRVGGYRAFDGPEDYDLWLRMASAGVRFGKVECVLLHWRDHASRLTRTDPRYRTEAFTTVKAAHLATLARGRAVIIWGAGVTGRRLARALEAHDIDVDRFIDIDPRKIGGTRRGRPVEAPGALSSHPDALVLAAVAAPGARGQIRGVLRGLGRREGEDFWACA